MSSKVHTNHLPGAAGRLSGIDFSSNNFKDDSISKALAVFKKDIAGQKFTAVKATEGTGYKNPYFKSEWADLGKQVSSGKMDLRIAYHYVDAGSAADGKAQAKAFLAEVGVKGKLPAGTRLALDFEGSALKTPAVLKEAADYIHHVTGTWPLVYTSSGNEALAHRMVPNAPKWEANYGSSYRGVDNKGGAILPSKTDTFDQYSDGTGYRKPYDLDVFKGSEAALRKFAGDKVSHAPVSHPHSPTHIPHEPTVHSGSSGAAVKKLQTLLDKAGFNPDGVDGKFGPHTLRAVMDYQHSRGLSPTGVVGSKTWKDLLTHAKAVRKPHKATAEGTGAASVAHRYLGDTEHYLEFSHKLPMDTWPPTSEDCANFVSACLQVAGKLPSGEHSDNVDGLKKNLLSRGWREIPMSQAKPGDVVCFNGPLGPDQHVELFNRTVDGKPQYIGSNNILADGTQEVSLDNGAYFNGYAKTVLAPPA